MDGLLAQGVFAVQRVLSTLRARARRAEQGQGMIEYVLILAFIALVIVIAMRMLQPAISHVLNQTACTLEGAGTPTSATPVAGATPCP